MNESETIIDIKERLVRIETMLEQHIQTEKAKQEYLEEKIKVANKRIDALESNQRWLVVTIIGAIIGAILNLIIK